MATTIKLIDLTVGTPEKPTFSVSVPKATTSKDEKGSELVTWRSYINPKLALTVKGKGRLSKGKSTKYDSYTTTIVMSAEERGRLDDFRSWLCTKLTDEKFRKAFGGFKDPNMLNNGGMFKKFWYSSDKEEDNNGKPISGTPYCIYAKIDTRLESPYKVPTLDSDKKLKMIPMKLEQALGKEIEGDFAFTVEQVCCAAGAIRIQFKLTAVTVFGVSNGPVDLSESEATKAFIEENMDTLIERSRKILGDLALEDKPTPEKKESAAPAAQTSTYPEAGFTDRAEAPPSNARAAIQAMLAKKNQPASAEPVSISASG